MAGTRANPSALPPSGAAHAPVACRVDLACLSRDRPGRLGHASRRDFQSCMLALSYLFQLTLLAACGIEPVCLPYNYCQGHPHEVRIQVVQHPTPLTVEVRVSEGVRRADCAASVAFEPNGACTVGSVECDTDSVTIAAQWTATDCSLLVVVYPLENRQQQSWRANVAVSLRRDGKQFCGESIDLYWSHPDGSDDCHLHCFEVSPPISWPCHGA